MGMAVRDAVLLRKNGMAGGRAAAATPEPRPREHNRPPAAAQEPQGPRGHAGGTSVCPAGRDGNGLPSEHGDVASLHEAASDTGQPGNPHPPDSPRSPIQPRVLFSPGSDSSADEDEASSHGGGDQSEDMAPGTTVKISAEGYVDDTYMLAICAMTPMLMLRATGQWTTLTGQEINVKKSLAFAVEHTGPATREAQDVELNGETLPREHEFRQLGIGVRMHPKRGAGPLLTKRVQD